MFDSKNKIIVPSSIPRIYFKHITINTVDNKAASIIFSDNLAVELNTENDRVIGVGRRLEPVAELVTDVEQLSYLRDVIDARLSEIGFVRLDNP